MIHPLNEGHYCIEYRKILYIHQVIVLLSCGRLHEELRFCLPWSDDGDDMFLKVHPCADSLLCICVAQKYLVPNLILIKKHHLV